MTSLAALLRSKLFVWCAMILFGAWPAWDLFVTREPSALADPLKLVLHHLGFVAAVLLVIVLSFTPVRVLWPKSPISQALNRHRRLVGVGSAVYAALHVTTHVLYEGGSDPTFLPDIFRTAIEKPFQLTGLIAFTLLAILAVTSPHAVVRWIGGRRWKWLHRLVYVAAVLVAYHQITARKIFPVQVLWLFVPLLLLEVARIVKQRLPAK